ncbi:MAG TPA: 4a-hydroxytetrahydrobiopterin dehydratase [Candidatus Nanopelagicales bacterium]|nr:4a-hydroxytetrahydrobiopterin dehydratase [Candidatus Nanopelagicales bacterium]
MSKRERLSDEAISAFLNGPGRAGWSRVGEALERAYAFPDYSAAVGFTMRVALLAERRDHHPDLLLGWGKVRVTWSTHDAGGITALDVEMAEQCDRLHGDLSPSRQG